jgi:2-C-methyl-D-erythritol 2,4-cyclodiphosphate synthase
MYIGIGYDTHRFVEGRKLILGGVEVSYERGLYGHSDADVLTHAICDALLGASGLGDIGRHFPDTSDEFKGISSLILLKRVMDLIEEKEFRIQNLDSIIIAEKPKLISFFDQMKNNYSDILKIGIDQINIKGTTTEGLGYEGRSEGISAQAVVLLTKKK